MVGVSFVFWCDSEIEFPLDVGCKRQGVKLRENFELKGIYEYLIYALLVHGIYSYSWYS